MSFRKRTPRSSRIPSFYVFSTDENAAAGRPSFNPGCLKWQVSEALKFGLQQPWQQIRHSWISQVSITVSSLQITMRHLLGLCLFSYRLHKAQIPLRNRPCQLLRTSLSNTQQNMDQGSKNRIACAMKHINLYLTTEYGTHGWVLNNKGVRIWTKDSQLFALYLEPLNFSAVAHKLYVAPTSSNSLVCASTSHTLRAAAEAELLKNTSIIDTDDLYSEADKAFEALSTLLGEDSWFFGNDRPALFDASVFAYTHLLLDDGLGWEEKKLPQALKRRENLVQHRERLLVRYYGGSWMKTNLQSNNYQYIKFWFRTKCLPTSECKPKKGLRFWNFYDS